MKAILFKARGSHLEFAELPDPQPGPGELVARVLAAPVLSYLGEIVAGARDYPLLLPSVLGCGPIGVVEQVGADATRRRPGDLIFCDPTVRARDDVLAPDIMLQGLIAPTPGAQILQAHFRHGAFAEKMLLPLENAVPLDRFPADDAARLSWINTLAVPYGGLLAAELRAGETVLINGGSGHFGSAAVAVALAMGAARVVAVGRNPTALKTVADKLGSRVVPVALSGEAAEDVANLKREAGGAIDCMLDMLSPIKTFAPTQTGILAVRPGGRIALMGGVQADVALPYSHIMRNSLTLRGQFMYPREAPARLAELVRSGLLDLAPFETTSFPLSRFAEAMDHAAAHAGAFQQTVLAP